MKLNRILYALAPVAFLTMSNSAHAYLIGTSVWGTPVTIHSNHATILTPIDLPTVVAAEHNAALTSLSGGVDYGYRYGVTDWNNFVFLENLLTVPRFSGGGTIHMHYAVTTHHFLESDFNTFDDFSDAMIFY